MKCYNHPETDAIGICKNCNKGLCKNCLTEIENGLACTATCVEEVKQVNSLINRNKQSFSIASKASSRNAIIYGIMGLAFLSFGLTTDGPSLFPTVMGIIFLIGAGLTYKSSKNLRQDNENEEQ